MEQKNSGIFRFLVLCILVFLFFIPLDLNPGTQPEETSPEGESPVKRTPTPIKTAFYAKRLKQQIFIFEDNSVQYGFIKSKNGVMTFINQEEKKNPALPSQVDSIFKIINSSESTSSDEWKSLFRKENFNLLYFDEKNLEEAPQNEDMKGDIKSILTKMGGMEEGIKGINTSNALLSMPLWVIVGVVVIIMVIFVLSLFFLVRLIQNHSHKISGKLQLIEDQYLSPGNIPDGLLRISNIITGLKSNLPVKRKWLKKNLDEGFNEINNSLGALDDSNKMLMDFVTNLESDFRKEIKQLYTDTGSTHDMVKQNLPPEDKTVFIKPLREITWFIYHEFPEIIDEKEKPDLLKSFEEWEGYIQKPKTFTDLIESIETLKKSIEPKKSGLYSEFQIDELEKRFDDLKTKISVIIKREYNKKNDLETKLDEFAVQFYKSKDEISKQIEGKTVQPLDGLKAGLKKIEDIVDFIRLDQRKYTRVTANLEKLDKKIYEILGTQESNLVRRHEELNQASKSIDSLIKESTQNAIGQIITEQNRNFEKKTGDWHQIVSGIKQTADEGMANIREKFDDSLQKQGDDFRSQKNALDEVISKVNGAFEISINRLDEKVTEIITSQAEKLGENDKKMQRLIHENLSTVIKKLEREYLNLENTLTQQIKEKETGVDRIIKKIEDRYNGIFTNQKERFDSSISEIRDISSGIKDTVNTALDSLRREFSGIVDQNTDKIKKESEKAAKEGVTKMNSSADMILKSLKDDLDRGIRSLIQNCERIEDIHPKIERAYKDSVEKFKSEISGIVKAEFDKMPQPANIYDKTEPLIRYINNNLFLKINRDDALDVINRLEGEPDFSQGYRKCAISLYDDLLLLGQSHKKDWYWRFLELIKDRLEESIVLFYNRGGKTIYDSYIKDVGSINLKEINKDHLRQLINKEHWGQIWDPLLRWAGFFKVYFTGDCKDICTILDYHSRNIVAILQNFLGYQVDSYIPMQLIPQREFENGAVEEMDEHIMFYREIAPRIKDNPKIAAVSDQLKNTPDNRAIFFIDRLGLLYNERRISPSRIVFYSEVKMKFIE